MAGTLTDINHMAGTLTHINHMAGVMGKVVGKFLSEL